jgi:hypothetical protein
MPAAGYMMMGTYGAVSATDGNGGSIESMTPQMNMTITSQTVPPANSLSSALSGHTPAGTNYHPYKQLIQFQSLRKMGIS